MQTQKERKPSKANGKGAPLPKLRLTAKDNRDAAVIVIYAIQTVGELSLKELRLKLKSMFNVQIHPSSLNNTVRSLRAKDLVRIGYRNDGTDVYKLTKLRFSQSITELAHVKNITEMLPVLREDPAGQAVLALLGDAEAASKGKKKQSYPADWHHYTVKIRLIRPMLGAHPPIGQTKMAYLASPYKDPEIDLAGDEKGKLPLVFERGPAGELVIGKNCVAKFFEAGLSALEIPYTTIRLWRFTDVMIVPEKVSHEIKPVLRAESTGRAGANEAAGLQCYEAIPPGTEITIEFMAPTTNYLSPDRLKLFCSDAFRFCKRTISPARGTQYGAAELVGFESRRTLWAPEKASEE